MAKPFSKDWEINLVQGEQWPLWQFTMFDKDDNLITAYTPKAQVRRSAKDAVALKEFTIGAGLQKVGATTTFRSLVDLPAGEYLIDVLVAAGGEYFYLQAQKIVVRRHITQP